MFPSNETGSARSAASACRQQRNPQKCEFQHAWVGTSERHRHLRIVPAAPPVSVPEDGPSPIPRLGPFLCALIRGSRSGTDGPWLGLNPVPCCGVMAWPSSKRNRPLSEAIAHRGASEMSWSCWLRSKPHQAKEKYGIRSSKAGGRICDGPG